MTNNSSIKKKTTTVTTKELQPPQLEVIQNILRELLLEYDSQEVKIMWQTIQQMS